jgi:hypothetical protein
MKQSMTMNVLLTVFLDSKKDNHAVVVTFDLDFVLCLLTLMFHPSLTHFLFGYCKMNAIVSQWPI